MGPLLKNKKELLKVKKFPIVAWDPIQAPFQTVEKNPPANQNLNPSPPPIKNHQSPPQ